MQAAAETQETPERLLLLVPGLGLGTTDQVRACALAGTEAPSEASPVSTAPAGSVPPARSERRGRRPNAREPRAQTPVPGTGIARSRSRAIAISQR